MKNRLEALASWVEKGMPSGATVKGEGIDGAVYTAEELSEMNFDELKEPFVCYYQDPPEQWISVDPALMVIKLQFGSIIRCKPKRNSLDDAFDEWCSIDGLLLSDIFKFDFQYLSKS